MIHLIIAIPILLGFILGLVEYITITDHLLMEINGDDWYEQDDWYKQMEARIHQQQYRCVRCGTTDISHDEKACMGISVERVK